MEGEKTVASLSASQKTGPGFPVNFTGTEFDELSLEIPRARALANILQVAYGTGEIEFHHVRCCLEMLYELTTHVERGWVKATSRQETP